MRSLPCVLAALLVALPTTGCAYRHITQPLDLDVHETKLGDKVGQSFYQGLLWSVEWGDAGTKAAADDGGITVIHHADVEILSVLFGLYYKRTTILYGE